MPMCWVLEIDEMNGLICVEMEYNCVYRPLEMEF